MIIATTTEALTDEDSEAASRVTRSVIDSYLMRPSVEEQAIRKIALMASNDMSLFQSTEFRPVLYDAAFVFMNRNQARLFVSGSAAAYHFEGGTLAHRTQASAAPSFGSGPRYNPRIEPMFQLRRTENAFLTASPCLARTLTDEQIEGALQESKSPEEWMERLKALMGPERQFCAITAFLPVAGPSIIKSLFVNQR